MTTSSKLVAVVEGLPHTPVAPSTPVRKTAVAVGFSDHIVIFQLPSEAVEEFKQQLTGFPNTVTEEDLEDWLDQKTVYADRQADWGEAVRQSDLSVDLDQTPVVLQ